MARTRARPECIRRSAAERTSTRGRDTNSKNADIVAGTESIDPNASHPLLPHAKTPETAVLRTTRLRAQVAGRHSA